MTDAGNPPSSAQTPALRRREIATAMFVIAERHAPTFAEIQDLVTKAKIQVAELKATVRRMRLPVKI